MNVTLYFIKPSQSASPELSSVETLSPFGRIRAVRGKTPGARSPAGTFQWTAAVRGLSLLFVNSKALGIEEGSISGHRESLAAALDYALSKPPQWFIEMFGISPSGASLGRTLFQRTNPERKRPGPVVIGLNSKKISREDITIYLDNRYVDSLEEILALSDSLESSSGPDAQLVQSASPSFSTGDGEQREGRPAERFSPEEQLFHWYYEEARTALFRTNIFHPSWVDERLRNLVQSPLFSKLVKDPGRRLERGRQRLLARQRLGLTNLHHVRKVLSDGPPIRLLCSSVTTGFILIARFLQKNLRLNVTLDFAFPYGVEVVQKAKEYGTGPEMVAICTGPGPNATLLNCPSLGYSFFLIGPSMSHRVVRYLPSVKPEIEGSLHLVTDDLTSAFFCLDAISRRGIAKKNRLVLHHCEPDEIMSLAVQGGIENALTWFPHYHFHHIYNGARTLGTDEIDLFTIPCQIMINEALARDPARSEAFEAAVRDAWLSLREDPDLLRSAVLGLVTDRDFIKCIRRFSGLYYLPMAA